MRCEALRTHPRALIICCSQVSFEEFARRQLALDKLDYIGPQVAGGPGSLAYGDRPERLIHVNEVLIHRKLLRDNIGLLLCEFPTVEEIVIIGHRGCGWYRNNVLPGYDEREDLALIAHDLCVHTGKKVRMFFAQPIAVGSNVLDFFEIPV